MVQGVLVMIPQVILLKNIGSMVMKFSKWLFIISIPVGIIIISILFMPSCMTAPDKEDYVNDECYTAIDCLYRLKDGDDKAGCSMLVEACRDSMRENRNYIRLEYCEKNIFDNLKKSECRLILKKGD